MDTMTDKCIVLDLDQTLVATQESKAPLPKILSDPHLLSLRNRMYYFIIEDFEKPGIGTQYEYWGVIRPNSLKFLSFCLSYFRIVAIWSAGKRYYVESIGDYLFQDLDNPDVIFTYDDVTKKKNGGVEKPLVKMIKSSPYLSQHMSLQNTFVLDDVEETFAKNKQNGILIPPYEPIEDNIKSLQQDDTALTELQNWLLKPEVMNASDVRVLDKSNIFSTFKR
jgi:hypothetical protein